MAKVALTGSTGMVGRHMTALLEKNKFNIVNVDREIWDLSEWKSFEELDAIFSGIDAVFHFGAYTPSASTANHKPDQRSTSTIFDVNIRSCACLAEWASSRNIPVIFLSGATVYRDPHAFNILECAEKTTKTFGGFYGFSKYMAEQILDHYIATGLRAVILRPSSIYGTGMPKDRLIAAFVRLAEQGDVISIVEPVDNKINLIHASDVAHAALQAYEKRAWGTYNIAASRNVTINELANQCVELAGKGMVKVIQADSITAKFVRFDLNYDHAKNRFGYKPGVDIGEGIKGMLENKIII